MTKNVKLIYDLIQKDLKAQGWEDEAIAEAIAESLRERQATGADDKTICVKEISYLSQESLQLLAQIMNDKQAKDNIFVRIKNWFVSLAKGFWHLNWEAKIGILFLIPPIRGVFFIGLNLMDDQLGIPLYLGLMAIAGAYLIKGNLPKKDK